MKVLILSLTLISSFLAFASTPTSTASFIDLYEDINSVSSVERVFVDELSGVDLYKVEFVFDVIECAENAYTDSGDACGPSGEIENVCLYAFYDTVLEMAEPTKFTCDVSIDEVLNFTEFDEL